MDDTHVKIALNSVNCNITITLINIREIYGQKTMKSIIELRDETSISDQNLSIDLGKSDGVVVRGLGINAVVDTAIRDHRPDLERWRPHCDGIQLIPYDKFIPRSNYALAMMDTVIIQNCIVAAPRSALQGISCFDGLLKNVNIADCQIETDSAHKVTLSGVISGKFTRINNANGGTIYPVLLRARIGGRPEYRGRVFNEVFVHSFKDAEDDYQPVAGDVTDLRRITLPESGEVSLGQFDIKKYRALIEELPTIKDVNLNCLVFQHLAMQCGIPECNTDKDYLKRYYDMVMGKSKTMSETGLDILTDSEGFKTSAYKDQAGLKTIGVGHLITGKERRAGYMLIGNQKVSINSQLTEHQVKQLLSQDLARFNQAINELVDVELNQHQFDALVHFAFNVGVPAFSGSRLLTLLNNGEYNAVPDQLRRWKYYTKDGRKHVSKGLQNRRETEVALWNGDFNNEA